MAHNHQDTVENGCAFPSLAMNYPPARTSCLKIRRRMKRYLNVTIVMVTQNIFETRRIADQVAFLHEEHIMEQGMRRHRSAFPAGRNHAEH